MERGYSFKLVVRCEPNITDWPEKKMPSLEHLYGQKVIHLRYLPSGGYIIKLLEVFAYDEYGAVIYRLEVEDRKGVVFQIWAPSCMAKFLDTQELGDYIWKYGFYKE